MTELEKEKEYFKGTFISGTPDGQQMLRVTDILNQKVSGLLTHISVMVAALSFIFGAMCKDFDMTHITSSGKILLGEIAAYLLITFLCLPSLFLTTPGSFNGCNDQWHDRFLRIILRRRKCFHVALWITVVTTVFVVANIFYVIGR